MSRPKTFAMVDGTISEATTTGISVTGDTFETFINNLDYYKKHLVIRPVDMEVTPALKRLISKQASSAEIQSLAIEEGMHTLHTAAALYVLDGTTSIAEMLRITFDFEE